MAPTEQDRIELIERHGRRTDAGELDQATVISRRAAGGGPRAVLERFRHAVISQSAADMGRVYAVDAVHEFPFTRPGLPSRLEGRDEIMKWTVPMWQANTFRYERYRTLAIHDTGDPATIIVEQEAIGTSTSSGEFALPNIVVLTVRDDQIVCLRDYVNILAAEAVVGAR